MMEQYQVSARKYRPMRFEDVVGQSHIAETLKNAISQGRVAHAFLFCGPRGVGKTTCARILARTLNCLTPVNHEPCGNCTSCAAFQQGQSFNIVEMDAASNNSVDYIRAITEQVRFAPQAGKYKVFIIDEVHMLSAQAFNAFLKTLEEPPPYAIFILATTEKHKILPTILSRCQIFDFKRISTTDAAAHLQAICDKEGIAAEPEALHVIGQKADGALRDALSIFDRVVSHAGGKLTYAHVIEQLNVLDAEYFFKLTEQLLSENHPEVLRLLDEILAKGFDAEVFINGLAEHLRNLLVCKDARSAGLLEASEGLTQRYTEQAALATDAFLLSGLSLLNECEINLRQARNRRLHTELYLLKLSYIGSALDWSGKPAATEPQPVKKKSEPVATVAKSNPSATAVQIQKIEEPLAPSLVPPTATANKRTSLRKPDAQVRLSLDAFEEAVEIETVLNAEKVSRFEEKTVRECWQAYTEMTDSVILRSNMHMAQLLVDEENKSVKVLTHNGVSRDMILQEKGLLEKLRSELHEPLLRITVEVDPSAIEVAAPKAPTRALSTQEKFAQMQQANPALATLVSTFDLKVDE